jgi:hypothetical protein
VRAIPPTGYKTFTSEERFRLVLAARGRNDEPEEDRLIESSPTIPVRMRDIFPHLVAFQSVAWLAFIELLDHAANVETAWLAAESAAEDDAGSVRWTRLAKTFGYLLRTKWLGWVRFCEELHVPPRHFWVGLPGLDRLDRALKDAEAIGCTDAEFVAIVNRLREPNRAAVTASPVTVEAAAAALRQMFDGHLELHSAK